MKRLLVTGGSGFIGTNIIEYYKTSGCFEILNVDVKAPKLDTHLEYFKEIDITRPEELETEILDFMPHIVIHLAARTDLDGDTVEAYAANTEGVQNLLDVLLKIDCLERAVFASSMYVCEPGYTPSDDNDYNPHTIYGQSKVKTEEIIKKNNPPYSWCIIRPTSIWGPFFGEPYNLFFKIVLARKYFHLGEKACKKTYGYIDNFVYQIDCILNATTDQVNTKVFYLGDYEPYNISQWANEIADVKKIKIPKIPFFAFQGAALFGDIIKVFGVKFPMTSFRLKNMTTDNIYDMKTIKNIAPNLPVSRLKGTFKTVAWLEQQGV
ncbi:NAD-dependent epimerase/dehydratase family protein [Leeuwenhoekiella sp. H156]|uniref:NAD-dependent epimerase/dehydratase family protein n=1 Tax=Leeuwenhoekiella sp. H156 TaxID=3450128 RepID=UPI003FA4BEDA